MSCVLSNKRSHKVAFVKWDSTGLHKLSRVIFYDEDEEDINVFLHRRERSRAVPCLVPSFWMEQKVAIFVIATDVSPSLSLGPMHVRRSTTCYIMRTKLLPFFLLWKSYKIIDAGRVWRQWVFCIIGLHNMVWRISWLIR